MACDCVFWTVRMYKFVRWIVRSWSWLYAYYSYQPQIDQKTTEGNHIDFLLFSHTIVSFLFGWHSEILLLFQIRDEDFLPFIQSTTAKQHTINGLKINNLNDDRIPQIIIKFMCARIVFVDRNGYGLWQWSYCIQFEFMLALHNVILINYFYLFRQYMEDKWNTDFPWNRMQHSELQCVECRVLTKNAFLIYIYVFVFLFRLVLRYSPFKIRWRARATGHKIPLWNVYNRVECGAN